ncbi:hypothetical protein GCM10009540_07600 [Streptomyces turgidiscabies]
MDGVLPGAPPDTAVVEGTAGTTPVGPGRPLRYDDAHRACVVLCDGCPIRCDRVTLLTFRQIQLWRGCGTQPYTCGRRVVHGGRGGVPAARYPLLGLRLGLLPP